MAVSWTFQTFWLKSFNEAAGIHRRKQAFRKTMQRALTV